jgi:hypothetical protein
MTRSRARSDRIVRRAPESDVTHIDDVVARRKETPCDGTR